jgi:hypothetical protein
MMGRSPSGAGTAESIGPALKLRLPRLCEKRGAPRDGWLHLRSLPYAASHQSRATNCPHAGIIRKGQKRTR